MGKHKIPREKQLGNTNNRGRGEVPPIETRKCHHSNPLSGVRCTEPAEPGRANCKKHSNIFPNQAPVETNFNMHRRRGE